MHKFAIAQRVFLIASILLLSGCGSSSPNVQVNESSNSTVSYDENIHINNCGGKGDSEQTASRSFSTNIEGGIEIGVQQIVEGSISAKYSQYRNISKSQRLIAPPATNMEFVLRWSEEVRAGNVIVDGSTGTYEVRIPVAVEQISSQDLGCGNGNSPIPPTSVLPTPVPPTPIPPTPIPDQPSYAEKLCPTPISQSVINSWKIGVADVPTVHIYIDNFDKDRRGGEFAKGTSIPAGVIVAMNFDEVNANAWIQYPVIAIVNSGSWGLFQTTGDFISPNTGACRVLAP